MSDLNYGEAVRLIRLGRRSERRREAVDGCLAVLLGVVIITAMRAWLLMLAVGIAHAEWIPGLPTVGYGWSALLVWLTAGFQPPMIKPKAAKP